MLLDYYFDLEFACTNFGCNTTINSEINKKIIKNNANLKLFTLNFAFKCLQETNSKIIIMNSNPDFLNWNFHVKPID